MSVSTQLEVDAGSSLASALIRGASASGLPKADDDHSVVAGAVFKNMAVGTTAAT